MSILDAYFTEEELAQELKRRKSTLERWRRLRIGPSWVRNGKTPLYPKELTHAWLAAGGTKPRRNPRRRHAPQTEHGTAV